MCGLAGMFGPADEKNRVFASLRAMTDAIAHRGPDADGHWIDPEAGIALGHRRLSILDLSCAGAQPMASANGRWRIAFNGEIYNFPHLRADLELRHGTIHWQSQSDTEVLIESIARDGVAPTLDRLDGMFAFALWDREERRLTLACDAFGEKPLYWGLWNGKLLFASELKALEALPGFAPELDAAALGDFFKYSYVPAPATIWRGIAKLRPAHLVSFTQANIISRDLPAPVAWWDAVGDAIAAAPFEGSAAEARERGDALLLESTRRRMVSDVPLGALLSGGIDSSMTTALMQAASTRPVRTFSIGMAEAGYDESPAAAAVASHLGTEHTELLLDPSAAQAAIPTIADVHDEPFADSSQVPTYLVARMAREHVTVVLSGDGGDELFGGYNRYVHGARIWNRTRRIPTPLRKALGSTLGAIPPAAITSAVDLLGAMAPKELAAGRAGEKVQKLARLLTMRDEMAFHDRMLATSDSSTSMLSSETELSILPNRLDSRAVDLRFAARAMLLDSANYLPGDILTKVDRATMAVSLEARTPYLNRDLYRFAWSLPPSLREGGAGKQLLRDMLYARVPRELVDRPKAGFSAPIGRWLRGDLRDWAETFLSEAALRESGLLNVGGVRRLWAEHRSGKKDHETALWNVLMFECWRQGRV